MNNNSLSRRSSSSQRKLCVERLDSRAVLAASFFGGFESFAEIASQHDRPVELDRPAFVAAEVGHLANEDYRDSQLSSERANERPTEHFGERPIVIERIELSGNRPAIFADARPDTPPKHSQELWLSKDLNSANRPAIEFARLELVNFQMDRGGLRPDVPSRSPLASPLGASQTLTSLRTLDNTRTVDQAISSITRESGLVPISAPNPSALWGATRFSIANEQAVNYRVENAKANLGELSDGGMIELETVDRHDGTKSSSQVEENQPWELDQDTIDQVTESSEAQPSSPSTDADIATMEFGDGGMVRVAVAALPKSAVSVHATIDIQLDPNMGRFRTFQLAASPGHDFPSREVGRAAGHETFASVIVNPSPHEQAIEDEDEATQSPISISPLASVGVAIFGAIMVTAESRKRSASALLGETPQAIVRSIV